MTERGIELVVASDEAGGIGKDGDLPWSLPGDMRHFRRLTRRAPKGRRNAVIMGRRTWDSIPERFRPLAGRLNIVVSRRPDLPLPEAARLAHSLEGALEAASEAAAVFVIGGAMLYAEALSHPSARVVHLTRVRARVSCDTFLPPLGAEWVLEEVSAAKTENGLTYDFARYVRRR